jgi:hypothetical protein
MDEQNRTSNGAEATNGQIGARPSDQTEASSKAAPESMSFGEWLKVRFD